MAFNDTRQLTQRLNQILIEYSRQENEITNILSQFSNGYNRPRDIVAWLGEIYVIRFLGGNKQPINSPYSIITNVDDAIWRVKVTTRKGSNYSSWSESGAFNLNRDITHIAFVHLDDNYNLNSIWLFTIEEIQGRNLLHKGNDKIAFRIDISGDSQNQIFPIINNIWTNII